MNRPDIVIFDCDGVLVDSEALSNELLAEAITQAGWPMTGPEAREAFVGATMADVVAAVEGRIGAPLPASWLPGYEALRDRAFERDLQPVPGVREVLDALRRAGVPVAVASQGRPAKTALSLRLTGLAEFFDGWAFSAHDVERGKPWPDLYLHIAAVCGRDPSACAVVEDTIRGVRAGIAAGMQVFGFAAESDPVQLAAEGATVFTHMRDLPSLLGLRDCDQQA